MNRLKIRALILAMAASVASPWALADHDDRERMREVRAHSVETYTTRHDHGWHRGWHKPKHQYKHHHRHSGRHDYYERREYHRYEPYADDDHDDYYPRRRSSSSGPVILGSVIGGLVGHHVGLGDPGHTAVGALIGTVIGYDIARHR